MAVWPNGNQRHGTNPYRFVGDSGHYSVLGVGGASRGIHTAMATTASVPEGTAPRGAWTWPLKAGGMSARGLPTTVVAAASIIGGGVITGAAAMNATASGDARLLFRLSGSAGVTLSGSAGLGMATGLAGSFAQALSTGSPSLGRLYSMTGDGSVSLVADGASLGSGALLTGSSLIEMAQSGLVDMVSALSGGFASSLSASASAIAAKLATGSFSVTVDPDGAMLALWVPIGGGASFSLDGSGDLRGRSDLSGSFDTGGGSGAEAVDLTGPSIASIASAVWAHAGADTLSGLVTRVMGLVGENQLIDNVTSNSNGQMVSARMRLFASASDLESETGALATYTLSFTRSGTNLLLAKMELL